VPAGTVRGWLRRFRARAQDLTSLGTQLTYLLHASLGRLEPAGGWAPALHAALGVLGVAATAFQRRWEGAPADRWEALSAVTSGLLLADTTRPYPPVW
jgi:hypothetical protein